MVLRLTSRNVKEARVPREENLVQAEGLEGRHLRRPPQAAREGPSATRDFGSPKKVVAADLALDWVLQEIVQQARLATTATGAFIGIVRARNIVCQAMSGSNAREFVVYLNRDRRMLDSCLAATDPQRCRDSETSGDFDASTCRYLGARSVVIVPIIDAAEEILGIFGVFSPQADAFSDANIVALQTLSHRIGDAMAQIDRCTSVSASGAYARRASGSGNPLAIRDRLLRAAHRPLPAVTKPVAWLFGIVVVGLLAGWILSRTTGLRAIHTSAKALASATSPPVSVLAKPLSQPLSDPTSSSNAGTNHANDAAVRAEIKQSPTLAADGKPLTDAPVTSQAGKKIAARSLPHVPDLEIENTLDDASSGSLPSESADTSRAPSQSSIGTTPQSTGPGKKAPSTNAASSSVPGDASLASLPQEAVHPTGDPNPRVEATPPANQTDGTARSANADPALAGAIMISEETALQRITEQVTPDYPEDAKAQHVQGAVTVDVLVGRDGEVERVTPLKGDPRLLEAAVKAVTKWRFVPLPRNNRFVKFESHITVQFALP
jgi:TonB family protein